MWRYLRNKWQSLVFRLLFYFLLAILALAIIVAGSFANRIKPHLRHEILPNVERYIEYLIDDIGDPPNLVVAQELADSLPFELRIEGQGINWTSSPRIDSVSSYNFQPAPPPYGNVYFSHRRRAEYLLIQHRGYQYLFALDNGFRKGSERRHGTLFLLLGAIFLLLYFAIRRLFRPIEVISGQVEKIGAGDLTQAVEVGGGGELAMLADGINRMSGQIKTMLESKSGLLLAISHELRSPITRMRVNLELLDESDTQQQLIADLQEMESLVGAILESERLNSGHAPLNLERCQLVTVIEEVVLQHPGRKRIKTRLSPVEISADNLRLKLLVKNLIDNACLYSAELEKQVDVTLRSDGDAAWIEVADRGVGIDADEIPRLTEAFYRPDSARQRQTGGYGLGLYLCQLIVDAHGGQLIIESTPGKGTRVSVCLPLDNS